MVGYLKDLARDGRTDASAAAAGQSVKNAHSINSPVPLNCDTRVY